MMELGSKFLLNELEISPLGLGGWQIGDSLFWNYGQTHQYEDVYDAFAQSIKNGVNFIDTAEVYGFGRSEKIIGEFIKKLGVRPIVASKFFPYPWRLTQESMIFAVRSSLKRLSLEHIDLYQVHWPFLSSIRMKTWSHGLTKIVEAGLSRYVGVSNFNSHQTERMHGMLQKNGIMLASNQLEYSLLNRKIEKNGLMKLCNDLGITILAYSPIAQGMLTGKYNIKRPKTGLRKYTYGRINIEKLNILIDTMRRIGHNYGGKSPTQVALNWLICKGVLPIPGAKNGKQAKENAGALGWRLNEIDINILEETSDRVNRE